jgi:hypothetical protein
MKTMQADYAALASNQRVNTQVTRNAARKLFNDAHDYYQ